MGFGILVLIGTLALVIAAFVAFHKRRQRGGGGVPDERRLNQR